MCHRARVAVLRCVRLAVDVCFALLNGLPARRGRRGRLVPPKTERGNSESNEFALKLPRSVYRLAAGVAPDPLSEGQHRARPTARAAFGYSRGGLDSTRTLRGHFARAARIVRPSIGGASGHFKHEGGRRARRGRCCLRGSFNSARHIAICRVRESGLRGKTGGWGDLALRGNAGKPCGPKRSAERTRRCRDRGKHPHKTRALKRGSRQNAATGVNSPVE